MLRRDGDGDGDGKQERATAPTAPRGAQARQARQGRGAQRSAAPPRFISGDLYPKLTHILE